jgi:hypothetical protein
MRNRMHLVQVMAHGCIVTIRQSHRCPALAKAPFFARMEERYGTFATKLLSKMHTSSAPRSTVGESHARRSTT